MSKKQVTAGLIVASIMSSNVASVKALLNEKVLENILDEKEDFTDKNDDINSGESNNGNKEESGILNEEESNTEEDSTVENDNLDTFIEIKDKNLLKVINLSLNKEDLSSKVSQKDVFNITDLNLSNYEITDLSGLEYFKNLQSLDISNNNISDISSLSSLSKLKEINAINNNIYDIECLKELNLIKADFSNQNIHLEDMVIASSVLNIKNPIKTIEGLEIEYTVSNDGIYLDGIFTWNDLLLENYNLEILFNGSNENIKFSGTILQSISKDDSVVKDIQIDMTPTNHEWVNSDLTINYNISGTLTSLIDKIELPNEKVTSDLTGSFNVSSNGIYNLKAIFKNGEFIEKNIEIKNIDKDKPIFNLLSKTTKNDVTSIELEAIDTLSGIDYILLPNKKKVYDNKITYSSKINETIYFKAFDLAGNYEEFKIYSENIKDKLPTIYASNKEVILGTKFNPLKGVSAKDYKGNDITSSIKILSNPVDIHSLGEYIVTYGVQDSNGYETTKDVIVEVVDRKYTENSGISPNNKDILQSLESNNLDNSDSNKSLSTMSKNTYFTAIIFSMISGFIFFFKSGRDDF